MVNLYRLRISPSTLDVMSMCCTNIIVITTTARLRHSFTWFWYSHWKISRRIKLLPSACNCKTFFSLYFSCTALVLPGLFLTENYCFISIGQWTYLCVCASKSVYSVQNGRARRNTIGLIRFSTLQWMDQKTFHFDFQCFIIYFFSTALVCVCLPISRYCAFYII